LNRLPHECVVCQEEIFGPVVTVIPFDTEQEAIDMANGTKYGLSASIWTTNGQRAHRLAKELEVSLPYLSYSKRWEPFGSIVGWSET
jgi:aminomuconate-semialdehyde/2-hydroxymuconate-6-semialdehyde dehydrogenase